MRVFRAAIIAVIVTVGIILPDNVFSYDIFNFDYLKAIQIADVSEDKKADVKKFDLLGTDELNKYNTAFRMDPSNIKSIKNNGGHYGQSVIDNAIDDDFNTHWETNSSNSESHQNEVEIELKEARTLNRIVYAARKDAGGKGFAKEFEIYGSASENAEDYELVATGSYKDSNVDTIEIQFTPTEFKHIKFVYVDAHENWASAAEFQFYSEDTVSDDVGKLFTDDTYSKLNEAFANEKVLAALEKEAKNHPLYEHLKEDISNARILLNGSTIETRVADTRVFNHYKNKAYTDLFQMDYSNIKSIRTNAGHYASAKIENAIDKDLNTYWETNQGNSNTFTNEVEIEFKNAIAIDRVIYGARPSDQKGFAEEFEIYGSETTKGDTYERVSSGRHQKTGSLVEAKFKETKLQRVKFKFKQSDQNWATLSEIAFYAKDELAEQVDNLFTDGMMNELQADIDNAVLTQLEKDIKNHPIEKELQEKIDIAKDVLTGESEKDGAVVTASQRGNPGTMAGIHQIPRNTLSLDSFGRYIAPEETITVFVEADKNGVMPNILLGKIADDKNGWLRRYPLSPGLNTIKAPDFETMSPAIIYVENQALPSEQAYPPKVRLIGGTDFPTYFHGETDPKQFKKDLEKYVKNVSYDDKDFKDGKPKDLVYNVAELVSENNTIATSATGALQAIKEMESQGTTVSDTMDEWEQMWHGFQKISGNIKDHSDPKKGYYIAKFNSRVFSKGSYAWSAGGYTGYNGGDDPKRDTGFFKNIVKPISTPGNDDWAYYHEWGHNINNGRIEHLEVTNNLYATIMRKELNGNLDDRVDWNSLYKRFQGEKVKHDYFTYLGVLSQIQYYYGEDSYGKASVISRVNPDGVMDGLDNNLQRLVIAFSIALETDFTTFFDEWGYVTATEKMKDKVAHLPKPDVKLEYMHSSGRDYDGSGFANDAKLGVDSIKTDEETGHTTLTFNVDKQSKDAVMGYEVLRDGKVIAYQTDNTFVDNKADKNKEHMYEVIAYDKRLTPLASGEIQSKTPTLSVEETVTLKLRQAYDPMDYANAASFVGKDISKNINVTSNNVNTKKKGKYKIVFEIEDEGITTKKTTHVTVVSDYDYLSDVKEKSHNIQWGGLKKDTAPSGNPITLFRQGLLASYAKGLGTHANSEVIYNVEDAGYEYFESYIGIDQNIEGDQASATFEVWVDGKREYTSPVFRKGTEHAFIQVPIKNRKEVKLITTDANNGNTSDHTVWAEAKFITNNSKPKLTIPKSISTKVGEAVDLDEPYEAFDQEDGDLTDKVKISGIDAVNFNQAGKYTITYSVTDSDGNKSSKKRTISVIGMENYKYLSDLEWKSESNNYVAPVKDLATSAKPLRLTDENGKEITYKKGLGTHATTTIVYDLSIVNAEYLTSYVGVDRAMYGNDVSSISFEVYVDGEIRFDSGLMRSTDPQKYLEVSLAGGKELELVVTDGGNGIGSDHATWGDAKLYTEDEIIFIDPSELKELIEEAKSYESEAYTEESFTALQEEIRDAEQIVKDATAQDEIAKAIEKLQIAIDKLEVFPEPDPEPKPEEVDTSELERIIINAKAYQPENYTEASFANLTKAINEAEDLVKNAKKQAEIDEASNQLQAAIDQLDTIPEVEPEPEKIDTSKLEKLINNAKTYQPENYTEASFSNLAKAINEAQELVKNAKKQAEIDEEINQLQAAIDQLDTIPEVEPEPEKVDTSKLEKLISNAKVYLPENYTEASFANLQQEIKHATQTLESATTQEDINQAVNALQKAINNLETIPVPEPDPELELSKTVLTDLIEHAKTYEREHYTDASFANLTLAIKDAKQTLEEATTQEEINQAVSTLQKAINNLDSIPDPAPEPEQDLITSDLINLIEHAQTYEQERYTDATFANLLQAIKDAELTLEEAITQGEINQAVSTLQKAINNLDAVPDPEPDPEQDLITSDLINLIEHAKTYEQERYTDATFANLLQAIKDAELTLEEAITQGEINQAVSTLQKAINNLDAVPDPEPDPEQDLITSDLINLIEHAKTYEQERYTDATFASLIQAIKDAEQTLKNASTQVEINQAVITLQQAINNLEKDVKPMPEVDKSLLLALLEDARKLKEADFTDSTWGDFASALAKAEEVFTNENAQQDEINDLRKALLESMDALVENPEPVDKTALQQLIVASKNKTPTDYTADSWKTYSNALEHANSVLKDEAATQSDADTAANRLNTAIEALVKAPLDNESDNDLNKEPMRPSVPKDESNEALDKDSASKSKDESNATQQNPEITTKDMSGDKLPKTTTNHGNMLLIGFLLLLFGCIFNIIYIRKKHA